MGLKYQHLESNFQQYLCYEKSTELILIKIEIWKQYKGFQTEHAHYTINQCRFCLFWFFSWLERFTKYQLHCSSSRTWPRFSCSRTSWDCHSRLCRNVPPWSHQPWQFRNIIFNENQDKPLTCLQSPPWRRQRCPSRQSLSWHILRISWRKRPSHCSSWWPRPCQLAGEGSPGTPW